MSIEVDTNVLLRLPQVPHVKHTVAHDAVRLLLSQRQQLCLMPQNLYEYWVVATRPAAQNGLGMTVAEAAADVAHFRILFTVLDDTPAILPTWEQLVTQHQVLGKNAHDARLVAAMMVHGIGRILTFNTADFQRFPGIVAHSPLDIIASSDSGSAIP